MEKVKLDVLMDVLVIFKKGKCSEQLDAMT